MWTTEKDNNAQKYYSVFDHGDGSKDQCHCVRSGLVSPEWAQSRLFKYYRTSVCWQTTGDTYQAAHDFLLREVAQPEHRYHYLHEYLNREFDRCRPAEHSKPGKGREPEVIANDIGSLLVEIEVSTFSMEDRFGAMESVREMLDTAINNLSTAAEEG